MSSIIKQHISIYEFSEDTGTCAFFIPYGFNQESKKSLAHLTEHCILALVKEAFLPEVENKPLLLFFNAMTTAFYTCIWFTAPTVSYRYLKEIFINAIEQIHNKENFIDETLIQFEKSKIYYELTYLKQLNKENTCFKNINLLENKGLSMLSDTDVKKQMQKYISSGGILIEYGGIEEFENMGLTNLENIPQIYRLDNTHVVFFNINSIRYLHALRFLIYVLEKNNMPVYLKQHTNSRISIFFSKGTKNVIMELEKKSHMQLQLYLEEYYTLERKNCNDNIQFVKRLYKLYRQNGIVCTKKEWLMSIYDAMKLYENILFNIKELENGNK